MEHVKPEGYLYDFLYRDRDKIASLYAQIFGGCLLSVERTVKDKEQRKKSFTAGVGIAKGNVGFNSDIEESLKQIEDPHDLKTIDVLSFLLDNEESYPLVIKRQGSLLLMDSNLIKILTESLGIASFLMEHGASKKERKAFQTLSKVLSKFLNTTPILPAFLLKSENELYGGTLREQFLAEPISSYYLKQGNKWLDNMILIGFREKAEDISINDDSHISSISSELLPVFSSLIFPEHTQKVVPLAILRKI